MRQTIVSWLVVFGVIMVACPVFAWAGPGPNAPSGLTALIHEPWNAFNAAVFSQANGWTNNFPGCNASIVQDGSAPESPPNVFRAARAAGSAHGNCSITKGFQQVSRVYGRIRFRTSNPFYGVSTVGAKLIGYVQHTPPATISCSIWNG